MTENDKKILYHENLRLKDEIKRQQDHIHYLESELSEIRSLKAHLKKFARKKTHAIDSKIERVLESQKMFQPVIPQKQGDILMNIRQADQQNLVQYNKLFLGSSKVRVYRKAKRATKRLIGRSIGMAR